MSNDSPLDRTIQVDSILSEYIDCQPSTSEHRRDGLRHHWVMNSGLWARKENLQLKVLSLLLEVISWVAPRGVHTVCHGLSIHVLAYPEE